MSKNINQQITQDTAFMELTQKEAHLIKILRNIAYGEFTIIKQANAYTVAKVVQSIKLDDDPSRHVTVRDSRNIGIPEDSVQQ